MMKQAGRQAVDYYMQIESHCITYLMYMPSATCASSMVGRNSSHPDADTVRPGALQTHRIGYVP